MQPAYPARATTQGTPCRALPMCAAASDSLQVQPRGGVARTACRTRGPPPHASPSCRPAQRAGALGAQGAPVRRHTHARMLHPPGIVIIVPTSGIKKPAPTEARTSRMGRTKPLGAPAARVCMDVCHGLDHWLEGCVCGGASWGCMGPLGGVHTRLATPA